MSHHKIGLVLSGGGAKGAYQVGVIRALAEYGIPISCVSGASIGALNGTIVASADHLTQAAEQLEAIWVEAASQSPVELDYMELAKKMGILALGVVFPGYRAVRLLVALSLVLSLEKAGVCKDESLYHMMDKYFSFEKLQQGLPLYVSLYKSKGTMMDVSNLMMAIAKIKDTPKSEFFHMQSLPREDQINALLASAAIPLAFSQKEIGGQKYSDGGQGGWYKAQGNTPIAPLLGQCHIAIVTKLEDESPWNRNHYADIDVIEIKPQKPISKHKIAQLNAFDFSEKHIYEWMQQGYEDTKHCFDQLMSNARYVKRLKGSEL
ncbi:MAG: patatin-like phospholipase family protein [Alcaligenaceae bacterium]|nr:patatin-like phospholipase family protein [Alcaligenaceae bacterium]